MRTFFSRYATGPVIEYTNKEKQKKLMVSKIIRADQNLDTEKFFYRSKAKTSRQREELRKKFRISMQFFVDVYEWMEVLDLSDGNCGHRCNFHMM